MIVKTVNKSEFVDTFKRMGYGDNFSHEGLKALYDYIDEFYEYDTYELDVVKLCCEFSEDEIKNILKEYNLESLDDLRDNTMVIEIPGMTTIIYQQF